MTPAETWVKNQWKGANEGGDQSQLSLIRAVQMDAIEHCRELANDPKSTKTGFFFELSKLWRTLNYLNDPTPCKKSET